MTGVDFTPKRVLAIARPAMIATNLFAIMLWLATIATAPDGSTWWPLPALWVVAVVGNIACMAVLIPRWGLTRAEDVRALGNVLLHIPVGVICHWNFASWLFLPFLTGNSATPAADKIGIRVPAMVLAYDVVALATGARWYDAAAFSGIAIFFHVLLMQFLQLSYSLVDENDRAMTKLQAAQRAVIAQEKLASIGQLAAGVAHEINNPMCFVTANVTDLLEELRAAERLPPQLEPYRDHVLVETLDGIVRVNSIVDDLRRFARGEPELHVSLDLTKELGAAVRMAKTQLRPGQRLILEAPPTMPMIGMPRQLGQAVLNMIVNGLQALGARGEVRVRATELESSYRVTISDDGAGMTEDTKQRLFQPFFTTKEEGGVGIGLSVVVGIVTAHGGTIEVDSELGRGSRFRMTLPKRGASHAAPAKTRDYKDGVTALAAPGAV